jgi:ribosomal protein L32
MKCFKCGVESPGDELPDGWRRIKKNEKGEPVKREFCPKCGKDEISHEVCVHLRGCTIRRGLTSSSAAFAMATTNFFAGTGTSLRRW